MWALLLVCLVAAANAELSGRIVSGTDATREDHKYICSLQVRSGSSWFHICGCIIYNDNNVVTAAHCLSNSASSYRIVVGNYRMNSADDGQQAFSVSSYTNHPNYNGNAPGYPNDIAVMRLSSSITRNAYVEPGTFSTGGNYAGQTCTLSGWGRLSGGGSTPNILQKVDLTKLTNSDCSSRWSSVSGASINSGHICFFGSGSACSGDSGGPARCGNEIVGVTSWGISTCSGSHPSVYTRVSSFTSWLRSQAGDNA